MEHERNGASEEARLAENLLHLWHGTLALDDEKTRERERERERVEGPRDGRGVMVGSVSC